MGKSTYFRNAFLNLILQGDTFNGWAEDDSSSPVTTLYLSLHTADPGVGNTQASSEASYGGYARQSVLRDPSGFTVTGNVASLASQVNFPAVSDGTVQTITHWALGEGASGATPYMWSGTVTPNIPVSLALTPPALAAGTAITEL